MSDTLPPGAWQHTCMAPGDEAACRGCQAQAAETDALPVDVAVGRALRVAVHEHVMFTETEGGFFDGQWGISGAYHWCACGWRSDDEPWRDAQTYVRGMAQAREDHLSNAMFAAVRPILRESIHRVFDEHLRDVSKPPGATSCGGCAGLGSHRRWCRTQVGLGASIYGPMSERLGNMADQVGANNPGLANGLYALSSEMRDWARTLIPPADSTP